jgi:hypothetical protein
MVVLHLVTKAMLVAQFLKARAWWRLDSAGASPQRAGRSVVSLLDAAAYLLDIPDSDPDIAALEAAGCFRGDVFDPGPAGAIIVRGWQLADEASAGPHDLLAGLARAVYGSRLPRRDQPCPARPPSRSRDGHRGDDAAVAPVGGVATTAPAPVSEV